MNTSVMPKVVSSRDIQRNYRKIFNEVKKNKETIVVLTNNVPDVAIVDIEKMDELLERAKIGELSEAMKAIQDYTNEKKTKKLKTLKSLKDLV